MHIGMKYRGEELNQTALIPVIFMMIFKLTTIS